MDQVTQICKEEGITLIEDCAHALGCQWNGRDIGTYGAISCFSCQTNKLLNAGEGGLNVTDDPEIIAKSILHSGSYGLFKGHYSRPEAHVLEKIYTEIPNFSMRMTNTAAAILRPQIALLKQKVMNMNRHGLILSQSLSSHPFIEVPEREVLEGPVYSSFQFQLSKLTYSQIVAFCKGCISRGVKTAWFGRKEWAGFTSTHLHWQYIHSEDPSASSAAA